MFDESPRFTYQYVAVLCGEQKKNLERPLNWKLSNISNCSVDIRSVEQKLKQKKTSDSGMLLLQAINLFSTLSNIYIKKTHI